MWKSIADWAVAFFGMSREVESHRERIRQLETRVRDLEEVIRLLSQEHRHRHELDVLEREKLLMKIEAISTSKSVPDKKRKKN